jgi:ABC-type phosphate transport system permease subunit
MDEELILEERTTFSSDQRAELMLGALVCVAAAIPLAILVYVIVQGWPSFAHNGLHWFGAGGNANAELSKIYNSGLDGGKPVWTFHAWQLIWSTILVTGFAVILSFVASLFAAIFLVEFAPTPIRRVLEPVVRVLASVPSVVYGLIGVLVLVPFIANHLVTNHEQAELSPVVSLGGQGLLAGVIVLAIMICPIMIATFAEGLRAVPRSWLEGSLALGVNRWRSFWLIAVRSARPALIAGTVLATARALGEAIALEMVSGGVTFAPNPADGFVFFLEPSQGLAATLIGNTDGLSFANTRHTLFAIAAVLLVSALGLSLAGWAARQPMKRYFNVGGSAA